MTVFRFTDASGNAVDVCNHSYKETRTEPTCTAGGKLTKVCKYCGKKVEETINAPGHSWSGWSTTTYPTCTAQGVEQRTCSRCSKAETRYITALGHNYSSEWTIDKQATCSAEGSKSKHCTRCDAKAEVTVIPKTAHSYKTTVVAPTLTAQGYTLHECTVCHYSYKDSYTSQITLPAVTGAKVKTQGTTSLTLAWDKNASANGYVIEQYKGGKWTQIAVTKNNTTLTFTVKGLADATPYSFRIKTYKNADGKTNYSGYTTVKAETPPAAVKNARVTSTTATWITLEWERNANVTGYAIEQYKGGKWTQIAVTKNNTTLAFTVKGLKSDTTYTFRVKAYRNIGKSTVYSPYTRLAGTTRIANVSTFTGRCSNIGAITLRWAVNNVATGYIVEVYRGGKWKQVKVIRDNSVTSATIDGLGDNETYTFRIKSFRTENNTTKFSEYKSVKVSTGITPIG